MIMRKDENVYFWHVLCTVVICTIKRSSEEINWRRISTEDRIYQNSNSIYLQQIGRVAKPDKTIGIFGSGGNQALPSQLSLSAQPKAIEVTPSGVVVVLLHDGIAMYENFTVKKEEKIASYEPMSLAVKNEDEIAIGGKDNKVYILFPSFHKAKTIVLGSAKRLIVLVEAVRHHLQRMSRSVGLFQII